MAKLLFTDHAHMWRTGSDYPSVPLTKVSFDDAPDDAVAYVFFGHVNVDFDGSPTAYGPPGINPPPDDDLGNAGNADQGWFGLIALKPDDPAVTSGAAVIDQRPELNYRGKYPVIQQEANQDPSPGYYVSATPHATGPAYLQNSYIDASRVAFGALSGQLKALGLVLGDHGLALRHDQSLQSGFFFADSGGNNYALGECSHRVGKDLGGSGRGNRFNNNYPVSFIVFPQTNTQDPSGIVAESDEQIAEAVKQALGRLASASNAADLALLMGFNEVAPPGPPRGTGKLASYQQDPDNGTKPKNYDTIAQGLCNWGFSM